MAPTQLSPPNTQAHGPSHSLAWSIPVILPFAVTMKSGLLMFMVGGDNVATFFPVEVNFVGQGSLASVGVIICKRLEGEEGQVK